MLRFFKNSGVPQNDPQVQYKSPQLTHNKQKNVNGGCTVEHMGWKHPENACYIQMGFSPTILIISLLTIWLQKPEGLTMVIYIIINQLVLREIFQSLVRQQFFNNKKRLSNFKFCLCAIDGMEMDWKYQELE